MEHFNEFDSSRAQKYFHKSAAYGIDLYIQSICNYNNLLNPLLVK